MPFVAEQDGGGRGYSTSTGGAGGQQQLGGHNPLCQVSNYHSPREGAGTLPTNPCALLFALVGQARGAILKEARSRGIGRSAGQRAPLRPQLPSAASAPSLQGMLELRTSTLHDAYPNAINPSGSNVSPGVAGTMAGATLLQRELARAGEETWRAVLEAAKCGELDVVLAHGGEQMGLQAGAAATLPGTVCTPGFLMLMSAAGDALHLQRYSASLGLKGATVRVCDAGGGQLFLALPFEHGANALYGRAGGNSMRRHREAAIVLGAALAFMAVGEVFLVSEATSAALLGGAPARAAYTFKELGAGGAAVIAPREAAEAKGEEAMALELAGGSEAQVLVLWEDERRLRLQSEAAAAAHKVAQGNVYATKPEGVSKRRWVLERVPTATGKEGFSIKGACGFFSSSGSSCPCHCPRHCLQAAAPHATPLLLHPHTLTRALTHTRTHTHTPTRTHAYTHTQGTSARTRCCASRWRMSGCRTFFWRRRALWGWAGRWRWVMRCLALWAPLPLQPRT